MRSLELTRLLDRLAGGGPGASEPGPVEVRLAEILARRGEQCGGRGLLEELVAAISPGQPLADGGLRLLVAEVEGDAERGGTGDAEVNRGDFDLDDRVWFWGQVAGRSGHGDARCLHADALLAAGRPAEAMAELLAVLSRDPLLVQQWSGELDDVAREQGDPVWLEYRLACLRAALAGGGRRGDEQDYVRELYGELCEDYRDDPAAMARVREVGRLIDEAVERGDLPRALVRRSPRR